MGEQCLPVCVGMKWRILISEGAGGGQWKSEVAWCVAVPQDV